jgi:hypothetical protein
VSAVDDNKEVCDKCKQVIVTADYAVHEQRHEDFDALGARRNRWNATDQKECARMMISLTLGDE